MVGIVVVCHSRALADAAVALAQEMLPTADVPIAVAAGLDEVTFGTDAGQIVEAITSVDQGSGVVVLMDLGSAVLSAELALELLDDEARGRVLLCPAPLVEGLVMAAVAAAGGATREEVAAEATGALAGKASHLSLPDRDGSSLSSENATDRDELAGSFTVVNRHGLHARPAARLVAQLGAFDARVRLRNRTTNSAWVPASSLSKVAALGALCGHEMQVRAAGNQAREALDHLLALAARRFDENDEGEGAAAAAGGDEGQGQGEGQGSGDQPAALRFAPMPASPGIGIGPAWPMSRAPLDVPDVRDVCADDPAAQWRALQEALATVRHDVQRVRAYTARQVGESGAALFDAHLLLLDDPELLGEVRSRVDGGQAAASAWSAVLHRTGAELDAIGDPYLQARAADLRAVGDQVLRALHGVSASPAQQPASPAQQPASPAQQPAGVLVAADLTPTEAAELDPAVVAAVLLAFGSPTAHSAILLRGRGIPAVVAAGPAVLDIPASTLVAVDGTRGEFAVGPPAAVLGSWQARAADLARQQRRARTRAASRASTQDGVEVLVSANIGSVADARMAAEAGADLAGLIRTEFLFLGRTQAPDVDEQELAYREIAHALGGRRITLRTLDVGGDKSLGYLPMPAETNPFLGVRGIRLALAHPTLLADQLLAMVRVAHDTPVSLMFPMLSALDELHRARRLLDEAIASAGQGPPAGLRVGIMVEVPATALKTAVFAPHVDFFSIGTNDLTQYALAAERGNDAVAGIGDPLDPGVLRLVDAVCQGARERARKRTGEQPLVAVCGELAADEQACALLIGLGVRALSVAPPAIPAIKQAVRGLHSRDATTLAARALRADGPDEVRALLRAFVAQRAAHPTPLPWRYHPSRYRNRCGLRLGALLGKLGRRFHRS